jgi:small subunit ribosomal protein S4
MLIGEKLRIITLERKISFYSLFSWREKMSRYTGPRYRISRRLDYSILETGVEFSKGNNHYIPGMHGKKKGPTPKTSDYGTQLKEKQKIRFTYGLSEKQLYKTFLEAKKAKGVHGENFIKFLESRLDNLVYRLGFAKTRSQARQIVNHGHIVVDGKKVDIPSYRVKPGQEIAVKESSRGISVIKDAFATTYANVPFVKITNPEKLIGKYERLPERNEVLPQVNEQLVVEFYNR